MIGIQDVKEDAEVKAIMYIAENQIEALGFTEHSVRHSSIVSKWAGEILEAMGGDPQRVEMARIAGYLHDIGNSINRYDHAQSGAILAYKILTRMGMAFRDAADIMMAIGNHDESKGLPVSDITSARASFFEKSLRKIWWKEKNAVSLHSLTRTRALSSAGLEHLPYKQRVGGSMSLYILLHQAMHNMHPDYQHLR